MRRLVLLLPWLAACGLPLGPRPVPVTVVNESGNAMDLISDSVQVLYPHTRARLTRFPGESVTVADPYIRRSIVIDRPTLWRVWIGTDSVVTR